MDVVADELLKRAATWMRGAVRRGFLAKVCERLCDGNARQAEYRFGWGRETVAKGLAERDAPVDPAAPTSRNRGQPRSEVANPQRAIDIRLFVEPHALADSELKSDRPCMNLSAKEVREALKSRGYTAEQLPSERG